ncbi:unnamed protein product [Phytophthora fragariaefolia]|uniref:Unnamed protein product n=1 Tax=Phytophthora fragariaefolia TaxID=1490495 RepID=A0A9W6Y4D1_9STRA|nr:unnamed protein product [Phytophthora fragariaefolia]
MSTPTTQAAGTPAASAAANTVVASSAMTGSFLASTPVVTSTVTTPSSPKRMMSLGEYKKARGNTVFARDELEALFDVASDAGMEDGEEDEEASSSTRDDPSLGSHRPREDDSDASSLKRSRSGSDSRSLMLDRCPAREMEATPLRLRPKIDRLHPSAVEASIPCAMPMGIACEHCHAGAVRVSERDINGYTGVRVPEDMKTLRTNLIAQIFSSTVGGRGTLSRAVGDYSSRSSFMPFGGFCGGGLRTPSPFPERPASGRSAAPTYRGSEEILSNEYENDLTLSPDPTVNNSLDDPASCPCASRSGGGVGGKTPRVWSARLR